MTRSGCAPGRLIVTMAPATGRFESASVTWPKITPFPDVIGFAPGAMPDGIGPVVTSDVTILICCGCAATTAVPMTNSETISLSLIRSLPM